MGVNPRYHVGMSTRAEPKIAAPIEDRPHGGGRHQGERPTRRLSADVPERDFDALEDLAAATGFNKLTTLVRAIRVLAELVKAQDAGGDVTINYPDGTRERLRFL